MSLSDDRSQIIGLLDRVARLYPRGVPVRAIRNTPVTLNSKSTVCLLISLGAPEGLEDSMDKLAQAICTKGLRVPIEHCSIRGWSRPDITDEELTALISETSAFKVVVCGEPDGSICVKSIGDALVLRSYALSRIASDPDIKRLFWEDLKTVAAYKRGGS